MCVHAAMCMDERWRVRAQTNEGERKRERSGNVGKQSFNGAQNNENGEREGGRRGLRKKMLCCVQSRNEIGGKEGEVVCQCVCIVLCWCVTSVQTHTR